MFTACSRPLRSATPAPRASSTTSAASSSTPTRSAAPLPSTDAIRPRKATSGITTVARLASSCSRLPDFVVLRSPGAAYAYAFCAYSSTTHSVSPSDHRPGKGPKRKRTGARSYWKSFSPWRTATPRPACAGGTACS